MKYKQIGNFLVNTNYFDMGNKLCSNKEGEHVFNFKCCNYLKDMCTFKEYELPVNKTNENLNGSGIDKTGTFYTFIL